MSFWTELKRRNVFRAGAVYLAAAWLLAQIGDVVAQAFAAPAWPMRTLLVLLALGLPIVLVVAWLFELTPEGLKLTREVAVEASITHATGRRLDRVLIGMIALLIAVLLADRWWPPSAPSRPADSARDPRFKDILRGLGSSTIFVPAAVGATIAGRHRAARISNAIDGALTREPLRGPIGGA